MAGRGFGLSSYTSIKDHIYKHSSTILLLIISLVVAVLGSYLDSDASTGIIIGVMGVYTSSIQFMLTQMYTDMENRDKISLRKKYPIQFDYFSKYAEILHGELIQKYRQMSDDETLTLTESTALNAQVDLIKMTRKKIIAIHVVDKIENLSRWTDGSKNFSQTIVPAYRWISTKSSIRYVTDYVFLTKPERTLIYECIKKYLQIQEQINLIVNCYI